MRNVLQIWICTFFHAFLLVHVHAQQEATALSFSKANGFPASSLSINRQRVLLLISSTHFAVAKELDPDLDSSLIYISGTLGISRLPAISDGFKDSSWIYSNRWFDERDPARAINILPGLKGTEHLRLMVLLGAYYCFQPFAPSKYKDSVLFFLSRAREESKALHETKWDRQSLCLLGKIFAEGGDLKNGNHYFDECIKECRVDGDPVNEAKAWMYRGLYTLFDPANTVERISSLQKAISIYNRLHRAEDVSNCWINIGYLEVSRVDLSAAELAFKEALRLQDSTGFPYTHYATDNISMATIFQGKYGEPLQYAIRSVKSSETLQDSSEWGIYYERLGLLYSYQRNKQEESLKWLQNSIQRNMGYDRGADVYRALNMILDARGRPDSSVEYVLEMAQKTAAQFPPQSIQNRLDYNVLIGSCYMNLKRFQLAEKYILEALELEKQQEVVRGNYDRASVYSTAGELYFSEGRYARAKIYLEKSLAEPGHAFTISTKLGIHNLLYTIDSAQGDYSSAFYHQKTYIKLLDSSLNIQMGRQAEELAVQYETEKKETEIKIRDQRIGILQQADLLRQASLKNARFVRDITIAGIILSLAIAGLLFWLYKQKQSASRTIGDKNEQLQNLLTEKDWLLKEVHHRVKNNLQTIISLLESQSRYLNNEALEAVGDSRRRIYAMSLLHQKIYQTADIKFLDMDIFIPEFISYLKESFGSPGDLYFNMDIAAVRLSITQAIPLVLILNEAVTNSIKHAFPKHRHGEIIIRLQKSGKRIILTVADNGKGMDPAMGNIELNSLGLRLMRGLSEELGGEIIFEKKNGTIVNINFEADSHGDDTQVTEVWQYKEYST